MSKRVNVAKLQLINAICRLTTAEFIKQFDGKYLHVCREKHGEPCPKKDDSEETITCLQCKTRWLDEEVDTSNGDTD